MKLGRVLAAGAILGASVSAACLLSIDDSLVQKNMADASPKGSSGCVAGDGGYREAVLCDQPIAYWRLGEGSATILARDEVMTFPGRYLGSPNLGQPGAIDGDPNTAVAFGATASTVMVADYSRSLFTGAAPASFEAWIRPTAMNGGASCFLSNDGVAGDAGRQGYALCMSAASGISFERFHDFTEDKVETDGAFQPSLGGPYAHVVGTYNGSALTLFVNGVVHGKPAPSAASVGQTQDIAVGALGDGSLQFVGDIDEVAIYGYALAPANVLAHYEFGKR